MSRKTTSRYSVASGVEAETEPGSRGRVLRNRLGITRKQDMDQAEFEALIQAQTLLLEEVNDRTRFTSTLLCQMHRGWLGSIYEWAGHYRTVEMERTASAGRLLTW